MSWAWDNAKNKSNIAKHGLDFALAQDVFDDPLSQSRFDMNYNGEERWQTMGQIGPALVLVVHTLPSGKSPGRIISARVATKLERKAYENGEF